MKKQNALALMNFLSESRDNSEVFYFEFPETRPMVTPMFRMQDQKQKHRLALQIYEFLATKYADDIDGLRTRVSFMTSPGEWWNELMTPELNLETLREFIRSDNNFLNKFNYLSDSITLYRETDDEQAFTDIVFSFFTHNKTRKDFFQFFSGFNIGQDIYDQYGYAIES